MVYDFMLSHNNKEIKRMNVQKPITVARQDFMEQLVTLCNISELPLFVISEVLNSIDSQLQPLIKQQLDSDRAEYEKRLMESEEQNEANTGTSNTD